MHNDFTLFMRTYPNKKRSFKFAFDENAFPFVPSFDETVIHTYKNDGSQISLSMFNTTFKNDYENSVIVQNSQYTYYLEKGKINNLTFTYEPSKYTQSEIIGTIDNIAKQTIFSINDPDKIFDADVEIIKEAVSNNFNKTINIVVMADGYKAGNDIYEFEDYAKDAFENASTFHYTKNRNTHDLCWSFL